MNPPFESARWIARPVPRSQRIVRQIRRSRTDWLEPGHTLSQTFVAEGPIAAVSLELLGPENGEEAYADDVRYTVALRTATGEVVAERVFEGSQRVRDYFGALLDVTPPAPAGDYVVVLASERGLVGWSTADDPEDAADDGISPLPVVGTAYADDAPVPGVRMIGVDTLPAANPTFRKRFTLEEPAVAASLAATVLGAGAVYVNDVRVGDEHLEPAVTDYDHTVLYRRWEVAHLLRLGENEIRIEAGRERFAARGGDVWGWNLAPWHREPMAIAQLEITEAAARTTVATDASWSAAAGPVRMERFFRGEDWVLSADAPGWEPAVVVAAPRGTMKEASAPPVRALAPIPPHAVDVLDDRRTVFDFGRILVGRVRFRITGSPGGEIRIRSGEQRDAAGAVLCHNPLVAGEAQLDTVRLETGLTDQVWEAQFGYRGFRWVQIDLAGDVSIDRVRAVPLYADVETVGTLATDEPIIEWIDAATAHTFRNNLHGIPTDTPIYEKNGWTADAHLATEALLHHFDLREAFGKWIDDHIDAQAADGAIPWIVPTPGWGRGSDPTWSSSAVLIPWYLYREYGDVEILHRTEDMVRRFADDVEASLVDDLWVRRSWGDWLAPGHKIGPEGMVPVGTIMAVAVFQQTAEILRTLGVPGADGYERAASRVARRYHREYFDAATGTYRVRGVAYRQVLNILPLAFGVVPDGDVAAVRRGLVHDIEQRTNGHLDCGAVGVRHLMQVLSDAGRDDLAITVLTRTTRPGWGVWYEAGETTLLETWEADARSRNHYFLGSVSSWIQQRVGAMRVVRPGWREFEIRPVVDPRVTSGRMSHRTPLGTAAVKWQRGPGGWRFEVQVPEGSTARVEVPGATRELGSGAHTLFLPSDS